MFLVIILIGLSTGYYLSSGNIITKNRANLGRTLECSFPLNQNFDPTTKIRIDALDASTDSSSAGESVIASSGEGTSMASLEKYSDNGADFGKYIFSQISAPAGGFRCRLTITDVNMLESIATKGVANCPIVIETETPIVCPITTPEQISPSVVSSPSVTSAPSVTQVLSPSPSLTGTSKGKCGDACNTSFDCDASSGAVSCLLASDRGYCSCPLTPSPVQSPTTAIKSPTPSSTLTPTKTPTLTPTPTQAPSCLQSCSSDSNCASGLKCLQVGNEGKRCVLNTVCKASTTQSSCWCFPPTPTPAPSKTPSPSPTATRVPTPTAQVTLVPTIPVCPIVAKVSTVSLSCQTSTCSFSTVTGALNYYVKISTLEGAVVSGFEKPVKLSASDVKQNGAKISFDRKSGVVYVCSVVAENSCGSSMPVKSASCGVVEPTTKVVDGGTTKQKSPPLVITSPPTIVTGKGSETVVQNPPQVIVKEGGVMNKSGGVVVITSPPSVVISGTPEQVPSAPGNDLPRAGVIENASLLLLLGASVLIFGFLL